MAEAASIHMHARLALILYPFLTRPRFIPRIPKRFHLWIDANGKRWFPPLPTSISNLRPEIVEPVSAPTLIPKL